MLLAALSMRSCGPEPCRRPDTKRLGKSGSVAVSSSSCASNETGSVAGGAALVVETGSLLALVELLVVGGPVLAEDGPAGGRVCCPFGSALGGLGSASEVPEVQPDRTRAMRARART